MAAKRARVEPPTRERPTRQRTGAFQSRHASRRWITVGVLASALLAGGGSISSAAGGPVRSGPPEGDVERRAAQAEEQAVKERDRVKKLEAFHASPEGKEARRASGERYRRLDRRAAREVARKEHRAFDVAPFAPLDKPGLRLVEFLDKFSARVEATSGREEGKLAIIDSTIPLATKDESGEQRPVDLSFAAAADGFSPKSPLTDLVVGDRAGTGSTVGSEDLRITPVVSDPGAPAEADASSVFYANVSADTDFAIRALPGGLQTLHQIRSPEAPEAFDLDLTLPKGATIRKDGKEFVVERDGKALYSMTLPVAWDADDRPVPVDAELIGTRLRMTVRHRSGDWMFPLVLDPSIMDLHHYWNGEGSYAGWNYYCSTQCGMYLPAFRPEYRALVIDTMANVWPDRGSFAEWTYPTPGPTAKIWLAEFQDAGSSQGGLNGRSCVHAGIYSRRDNRWEANHYPAGTQSLASACNSFSGGQPKFCPWRLSDGGCLDWGGTENNFAVFQVAVPNAGWRGEFTGNWIHGSTIGISDFVNPAVTGGMPYEINPGTDLFPRVEDSGVGVGRMHISNLDDPYWQRDWRPDCLGNTRLRCPSVLEDRVNVGDLLKPGHSTVRVQVWDKVNNYGYRDYPVINYSTSWSFGGADRTVNTRAEIDATLDEYDRRAEQSESAADLLWSGLKPDDQVRIDGAYPPGTDEESSFGTAPYQYKTVPAACVGGADKKVSKLNALLFLDYRGTAGCIKESSGAIRIELRASVHSKRTGFLQACPGPFRYDLHVGKTSTARTPLCTLDRPDKRSTRRARIHIYTYAKFILPEGAVWGPGALADGCRVDSGRVAVCEGFGDYFYFRP